MTPSRAVPPARSSTGGVRPRNAGASKQALLEAAQDLFGQRGYEGTTVRQLAEHAGVDHALIARYFGSKADLYIAALVAEARGDQPPSAYEGLNDMAEGLISRLDENGLGPVMQALIRSDTAMEIRQAAHDHMARRLVDPMRAEASGHGADEAQLRAEIVAAALIGVSLGRALGWFDALTAAPQARLVELVTALLGDRTAG
jgi:AcrR family transcriptional regulator